MVCRGWEKRLAGYIGDQITLHLLFEDRLDLPVIEFTIELGPRLRQMSTEEL